MENNMQNLEKEKRLMSGDTLKLFKKAAKQENVCVHSMIWLLTDVFSSGEMRSRAFHDAPSCVKDDGLIQEKESNHLNFTAWEFTEKGKKILAKARG